VPAACQAEWAAWVEWAAWISDPGQNSRAEGGGRPAPRLAHSMATARFVLVTRLPFSRQFPYTCFSESKGDPYGQHWLGGLHRRVDPVVSPAWVQSDHLHRDARPPRDYPEDRGGPLLFAADRRTVSTTAGPARTAMSAVISLRHIVEVENDLADLLCDCRLIDVAERTSEYPPPFEEFCVDCGALHTVVP
jgi:hypothetical protein